MESPHQLSERLRSVLLDGKWIANTNYQELLLATSWEQATQQVGTANTIAALTFHINYYLAGVLAVFEGGELEIRDTYSFDMPEMNTAAQWEELRNALITNAEKFAAHVAGMSEDQLSSVFVKEAYGSYRRNIEGMIEHSYYHMGQIAMLRKLITT